MSAVRKRTFNAWAGALVAAALVVAPLVTTGASASEPVIKGELVDVQPWSSATNKTSYWEDEFSEYDAQCFKHEDEDLNNAHGTVTDGGKTVTLNKFDQSWPGDGWAALIIKGGSDWNNVIELPESGVAYASPVNGGEQQSAVSHWIVCKGTLPDEPELEIVTPSLEYGCDIDGYVWRSGNAEWNSVEKDGSEVWTAKPKEGTTFPADAQTSWTVPTLEDLAAECGEPEEPATTTKTTYGEWVDGEWECGDTSVTQTREVYTTVYHGEVAEPTVTTTETQTRELTAEESEKDCEPTPTPTPTPTETPVVPATPASTDPGALAATGGGISPMFAVAGGAALFAGIAVVAFAAYGRRHASTE